MKSLDAIIAELGRKVREQERGTWKGDLRTRWAPWLDGLTYGVECKPGWQPLIEETMEQIAHAVGRPDQCPELRIVRLRENSGGLTVQHQGLTGEQAATVDRILDEAMQRSEGDERG